MQQTRVSASPEAPSGGGANLRTIAMPRDANPNGQVFGGWTLSQMDLAGAAFAGERAGGRVATVAIDEIRFLLPINVGDEVTCYCFTDREGESSLRLTIETWTRAQGETRSERAAAGVFTYVALGGDGRPRHLNDRPNNKVQ